MSAKGFVKALAVELLAAALALVLGVMLYGPALSAASAAQVGGTAEAVAAEQPDGPVVLWKGVCLWRAELKVYNLQGGDMAVECYSGHSPSEAAGAEAAGSADGRGGILWKEVCPWRAEVATFNSGRDIAVECRGFR